jgi:prevent-host-death family protein
MTIYGHNMVMKKAKVSELKARLSSYLAEVRGGDTLIVCDRATPIARLVPFEGEAEEFKIRESRKSISRLTRIRPVRLRKKADVDKLLRETRGEV